MASRRKRKRERRLSDAQETGRRGDRQTPQTPGGKGGRYAGLWADPSRSDLALLRKAVRESWLASDQQHTGLVEELERLFADTSPRKLIALAWVFLEMDRADLGLGKDRGGANATG